jgi:predicted small lipoprotein YifL
LSIDFDTTGQTMRSVYLPVVLVLLLYGCGHKGPLYLPAKPQPKIEQPQQNAEKPAAPSPAPSQEKQP